MRTHLLALPGALALVAALAAACSDAFPDLTGGTTGTGGAGGTGGASPTAPSSSSSTSVVTSTTATSSSGGGSDNGMPSDVYPAPHPAPPQVVYYGGHVLAAPLIVPIFFSNDDPGLKAQLEDFDRKVGATQYWAANTAEYGVGPATAGKTIALPEGATGTIDDSSIQAWLAGKLDGDDPAFPMAPYGDAIFVIHYPAGVTITFANGMGGVSTSCQDFGAYHSDLTLDGAHDNQHVSYAVMPVCDSFGPLTGIDAATVPESHEFIEAATDPYITISQAYSAVDPKHLFWESYLGGGEVGDMCTRLPGVFFEFAELPYTVQRAWSNKAALAGHDPCVPAIPGAVYFNAAAVLNDNVLATVFGQKVYVKGAKIPVGQTGTIELDLFSDGDTGGPWQVDVQDAGFFSGDTSDLNLDLDRTSGQNGEKLHLSVTVNAPGQNGTELLMITSTLGDTQNVWLAMVGN